MYPFELYHNGNIENIILGGKRGSEGKKSFSERFFVKKANQSMKTSVIDPIINLIFLKYCQITKKNNLLTYS